MAFISSLRVEDGLYHLSSMVLLRGRSRIVAPVLAIGIQKAYDNVRHGCILEILQRLFLLDKVCAFLQNFTKNALRFALVGQAVPYVLFVEFLRHR